MARKILLIDDDRLQWRVVQQVCRSLGEEAFQLDWAATYEEGLARLMAERFDACLLDYQLGERDGLQLIREAVARGCRTPIIFLTAESSASVDIEAMNAGAMDYLEKRELTPRVLERSLRYAWKLGETLEALRQMATHDELTGLLNRREFLRLLGEEAERAERFGHPFAVAMFDLDRFKAINDTHGHPAGDAVLRAVAARLAGRLRSVDRCARFGGEEFAVLWPETEAGAAVALARDLCAAVAATPVAVRDGLELAVTVSAGVASRPRDGRRAEELIEAADRALYRAKRAGRNRVEPAGAA